VRVGGGKGMQVSVLACVLKCVFVHRSVRMCVCACVCVSAREEQRILEQELIH